MDSSTKFDELLVKLMDECSTNDRQRTLFLRRARRLADFITEIMAEQDPIFRAIFENLRKCAFFESDTYMDLSDINPFLRFEAPFGLEIEFDTQFDNILLLRTAAKHDIVTHGFIGSERFDNYVRQNLCITVEKLKDLRLSRKFHYMLEYRYVLDRLHVIEARAVDNSHCITYEFKLAFKFKHSKHPCNYVPRTKRGRKKRFNWLALSQSFDRIGFGTFVPMMQFIHGRRRVQLRNMLRLLRPYFSGSIGMLRNLLVIAVETGGIHFAKLPLGMMLIKVLEKNIDIMETHVLDPIMTHEEPIFTNWVNLHTQLLLLLERIKELRQRDDLEAQDVLEAFDE